MIVARVNNFVLWSPSTGGKAGKGCNLTGSVQVRNAMNTIVKQFRFKVNKLNDKRRAIELATAHAKSLFLYARVGDGDSYFNAEQDMILMAFHLHEKGVLTGDIRWLDCPAEPAKQKTACGYLPSAGFETDAYAGNNYVSLYWGDASSDLIKPLDAEEQADLIFLMKELEK